MKAGNSGQGSILIGRAEAMSAFDALPASLRKYLGRGPYNWSSIEVLKLYRQEGDAFAVVDRLRRLNAERKRKYYEAADNGFRELKG
jgi:hypothetical protein